MSEELVPKEDDVEALTSEPSKYIELTPEQKTQILEMWNSGKDALKDLVSTVFGPEYDGRSKQAFAVKKFLSERQLKARPAQEYNSKTFDLSEVQKDFIRGNADTMRPMELLKTLFPDMENPSIASKEGRAIVDFYKSLEINYKIDKIKFDTNEKWTPPKQYSHAISRIHNYCSSEKKMDINNLSSKERIQLDSLIRYMNVFRFSYMMNEYKDLRDRDLMESSFIRFTHDKTNLTEEEVDLYMNWCVDIVNFTRIQREIGELTELRDRYMENETKFPQALVDQINKLHEAQDSNQKRQKIAQNDLSGKRKDRLEALGNQNVSVLQLIDNFKEYQKRKLLVDFAEARKKDLETEVQRIDSMDDLKIRIFGITRDEILNG